MSNLDLIWTIRWTNQYSGFRKVPRNKRNDEEKEREKRAMGRKAAKNVGRGFALEDANRKTLRVRNGDPWMGKPRKRR